MSVTEFSSEITGGASTAARALAFATASRHSRRVRKFKLAIITGCSLGALGLVLVTIFDPFRAPPVAASVGEVKLNGSRVTMVLPKLAGFRRDGRPYQMHAATAVQDVKKPNILELNDIEADLGMGDSGNANITAKTGVYDTDGEKITLRTDVHVKTDSGYDVTLAVADIDFKAGTVVSSEHVTVLMTTGTIDADSMSSRDNGKVMVFEGKVHTFFRAAADQGETARSLKGTSQ